MTMSNSKAAGHSNYFSVFTVSGVWRDMCRTSPAFRTPPAFDAFFGYDQLDFINTLASEN